jgi:hypothetical protein
MPHIADMSPEQLAAWAKFREVLEVISKEDMLEYLGGTPKRKSSGKTRTPRGSENGPAAILRRLANEMETFTASNAQSMGVTANSFHGAIKGLIKAGVVECVVQGKPGFKGKHPSHYRLVGKTGMPDLSVTTTSAKEVDAAPAVTPTSKVEVTVTREDDDLSILG